MWDRSIGREWLRQDRRKLLVTIVVVVLSIFAILNPLQEMGSSYVDNAFKRAVAGFAIARGLNGVISVAQGTEFAVQPAGVGVSFTPGEILDPVNDLVERFSWIMLLSTSSLGVQKVLLSMSAWSGIVVFMVIAAWFLMCVLWVSKLDNPMLRNLATRFFLLMLILRFMMPLVALANEWVYQSFLSPQYELASNQLSEARDGISKINAEVLANKHNEEAGIVDKAKELYRSAVRQIDFEKRLTDYNLIADQVSENTINLIVVFLMQTLVFPLLFLWIMYMLIRRVFARS